MLLPLGKFNVSKETSVGKEVIAIGVSYYWYVFKTFFFFFSFFFCMTYFSLYLQLFDNKDSEEYRSGRVYCHNTISKIMINTTMQYRCLTLNVKGINHYIKRKRLINYIKQHQIDIAFLQETHLTDKEHVKLIQGGYNQVFYSSFNSHARGVAILISKKIPIQLTSTLKDKGGRYVIIQGSIYFQSITLVNICT